MNDSFSDLQLQLASLVRYISSLAPKQTVSKLDRSGFLILQHIDAEGAASIKSVATYFKLDISTMSRQVRKLEQKGYLSRSPDPDDRRSHFLHVTAEGLDQLSAYRNYKTKRIEELFGQWDAADIAEFTRLLHKANEDIRLSNWEG